MSDLGPLFYWSPRDRLKSIQRMGLMPGKRNMTGPTYHDPDNPDAGEFLQPVICTSLDPATAWSYSHDVWKTEGDFDLWQFSLIATDDVTILPFWGGRIVEVRVRNRVPKSRLTWIGERHV